MNRIRAADSPAGLGPDDAAAFIGLGRSTLDRYNAARLVPEPRRVGNRLLYSRDELAAWLRHGSPPRDEWVPIWRAILAAESSPPGRR